MDQGWPIIFGVLLFIGLFNMGLALSVLRNRRRREPIIKGALSEILQPWKKEDESLQQLHREVMKLKNNDGPDPLDG